MDPDYRPCGRVRNPTRPAGYLEKEILHLAGVTRRDLQQLGNPVYQETQQDDKNQGKDQHGGD